MHTHKKIGIHSRSIATEHLLQQYASMGDGDGDLYSGALRLIDDDEEEEMEDILHIKTDTSFKRWTDGE